MDVRPEERREFQRLYLDPPIPGTLVTTPVSIVEIGVLGARLRHGAALEPSHGVMRFTYGGHELALRCEVVRTFPSKEGDDGSAFASGIRFVAAVGDAGDRLREMLAELVTIALQARRNVSFDNFGDLVDGDRTVRGRDAQFTSYRLENGVWRKRRVFLPEQPALGFTVASSIDSDEMQRLCKVYVASDDEGRRLIRLFAELSVSHALEIPPKL